ncbi:hypothetical protein AB0A05_07580 [Streptomyces sp. NPDC046374]|uniref:hypothetical protein n=1 Tax=Streptomyces sp. NPDC046374 TaxID=3154917 RepID=UPI0033EDD153
MTPLAAAAVGAGAALAGYAVGRVRLGRRLLDWADDQTGRPWWHPALLAASPVILGALAVLWLVRPHRAASRRTWSAEDTLTTPLPGYAPKRARHRARRP